MSDASKCPDLKKILKKWKKRLGLMNWDIKVKYCKPKALSLPSDHAQVQFSLHHQLATIRVKHPKYRGKGDGSVSWSVVHELVHLALAPFCADLKNGTPAQSLEEQIVNRLVRALAKR